MSETYHRHIVYHRWIEGDMYRPLMSFETLRDAVDYFDELIEQIPTKQMKVIDLEHIDMGDMMVRHECQDLIAQFRALRAERQGA